MRPVAAVSALLQLRVALGCCSYPWLGLAPARKISMMELQQPHALESHASTQRSNPSAPLPPDVALGCCSYPWLGLAPARKISLMELRQPHVLDTHESTQRSNPSVPLAPVVFRPLVAGGGAVGSTVYDEAGAWFLFRALDGVTYQIETEPGTLKDTTISLLDRTNGWWTTLVENDHDTRTSGRLTSYVEWTCPHTRSGIYYINVRGYGSTRGDFLVKVSMARQQSDGQVLRSKAEGLAEPTGAVYWEAVRAHTIEMKQQGQQTWQQALGLLGQAAGLSHDTRYRGSVFRTPAPVVATPTDLPQAEQELFFPNPIAGSVGLLALLAGGAAICRSVASRLQRRQLSATPPDHLLCPITRELFVDPVILVDTGQSYERSMITRWLHTNRTDPVSNIELRTKKLVPNIALRHCVELWRSGQCADRAAVKLDPAAPVMPARWSVEPAGARLKT